jgi:hypothetical protein
LKVFKFTFSIAHDDRVKLQLHRYTDLRSS